MQHSNIFKCKKRPSLFSALKLREFKCNRDEARLDDKTTKQEAVLYGAYPPSQPSRSLDEVLLFGCEHSTQILTMASLFHKDGGIPGRVNDVLPGHGSAMF